MPLQIANELRRKPVVHVLDETDFSEGRIECTCGATISSPTAPSGVWDTRPFERALAEAYNLHRRE